MDTLPCVFANEGDTVDTLEVTLTDAVSNVQVILLYSVFEEADIITRAVKVNICPTIFTPSAASAVPPAISKTRLSFSVTKMLPRIMENATDFH